MAMYLNPTHQAHIMSLLAEVTNETGLGIEKFQVGLTSDRLSLKGGDLNLIYDFHQGIWTSLRMETCFQAQTLVEIFQDENMYDLCEMWRENRYYYY